MAAFVGGVAPVRGFFGGVEVGSAAPAAANGNGGQLVMRCRRDLKFEKRCRNAVYARAHRKRVVRTNRRAALAKEADSDNEYLASLFSTMTFGSRAEGKDDAKGAKADASK